MLVDAQAIGAHRELDAFDICIAGAGAAGITLALELASSRLRVCVLESGGFDFEDETQALYEGRVYANRYQPLDVSRLRMLGGTTNHWAGSCGPLDAEDFDRGEGKDGWPFSLTDMEHCYERASVYCELGDVNYDIEYWMTRSQHRLLPVGAGIRVLCPTCESPLRGLGRGIGARSKNPRTQRCFCIPTWWKSS